MLVASTADVRPQDPQHRVGPGPMVLPYRADPGGREMNDEVGQATGSAVVSVVIPAHNEAQVIEPNLRALLAGVEPGAFEVVVVCNGCTDATADIARRVDGVR